MISTWRIKALTATTVLFGAAGAVEVYRATDRFEDLRQIGLIRFGRAAITVGKIVLDYKTSLWNVPYPSEEYTASMQGAHSRSAVSLLHLASANGGVFIKVGQHCASLEYLLPREYTKTLSVLLSKAPASSFEDVKEVVEQELKCKLEDVFVEFSETPCGAASLAQVHVAKLKRSGEKLAVKVQHRRVKKNARTDTNTMQALVKVTDLLFPEFKLNWLVEEVKKNLPLELDFENEGRNADRLREMVHHLSFLKVPEVKWDLTTSRVLTMEFCEGEHIDKKDFMIANGIDRHDVCRKLGRLISEMVFIRGYLHCDPHPGNVLVHKKADGKTQIVLLDHGLYLTLADDFRMLYSSLWLALLRADQDEIKRVARAMGVGELYGLFACMVTRRSWKSVTQGINKSTLNESERKELRAYAVSLIPQISQVLQRMPREMLLILKTNDLLRGIEHSLGCAGRSDGLIEMSKCVVSSWHSLAISRAHSWREKWRLRFSLFYSLARLLVYDYALRINFILPQRLQLAL